MPIGIEFHGAIRLLASAALASTNVQLVNAREGLVLTGWSATNTAAGTSDYTLRNGTATTDPAIVTTRTLASNATETFDFSLSGVLVENGIFLQRTGDIELAAHYMFVR